ncbi:Crp/Fnr family transcriptional regulator [Nocardia spumae]|uniref:Crp/Fnr family transcriptional regulator n=1 Tax=Nocardia spumae TaxID=2887190 RepID=UPI001D143507|nr:Crp/Fnr family transcriptional regulator [Nocardia spumae]
MTSVDELSEFAHLATLTESQLQALAATGRDVSYPAGRRLITEGEAAEHCWLIRSGRVLLDAQVPEQADIAIQTLGPGELLGWSWLVPPYRWQFGACVTEPVEAIEFDSTALSRLADADPQFGLALVLMLFQALLDRLQATRARLLDLYRNPLESGRYHAHSDDGSGPR